MDTYNNGNIPNNNVSNNNTPNGTPNNFTNGTPNSNIPGQPPQWNQPQFPGQYPNQFQPPQPQKDNGGFAIASLIIGLAGFFLNFCCAVYITPILGVLALVFGFISMKSSKKGIAIAGIILGGLTLLTALIMLFFAFIITATEYHGDFGYFLEDFFESIYREFFRNRY